MVRVVGWARYYVWTALRRASMALQLPLILAIVGAPAVAHAGTTKVACVGDSITEFSGWCEDLGKKLGPGYTVGNFGVSGTTLLKAGDYPYWTTAKFIASHDFAPDVVVIMLGTNDSKPQNWTPAKKPSFVPDYEALVDSYSRLPSRPRIFLNLPPPAGPNGAAISCAVIETEELPLIRQIARAKGVALIDVFAAFGGRAYDPSFFGPGDQVHPNSKGAQLIADTVFAALRPPNTR
jgi:lysophospholipase L1-like esterase